ncbi:DUF2332 domain-containing protein [Actinomadura kijaniata]|uniref:DUF2332 domain-containing protein n=1 Tax=Actinomadura namibiensis TaxID=182080 RepID=A0A7W3LSV7_ACTNM|nr:DUF2332 domain-containing protein [Actinomadura namibiensis]MBA8953675.1 hypothetical protein [Actinomadura namibiensis]
MTENLLVQADGCRRLGAPMYAELLRRAADDTGGPAAAIMEGLGGSALSLRLLGTVHRLVLEGRAPELAPYYPTVGGVPDGAAAWPAFRRVVAEHAAEIRAGMATPPQTNEVGRSAALVGGLLTVVAATGLPVRLLEIGASAGLNLRADRFRYLFEGGAYGPEDSPVVLPDCWEGGPPPVDAPLEVVERRGCDLAPLDPADPADQVRLLSYVWPEQAERVARLRAAFAVAAEVPATVVRDGAAGFLDGLAPRPGTVTVVWHSIMRHYVPADEWARVEASLAAAGAAATPRSPVAHLALEPRDEERIESRPLLKLRLWPGGGTAVLAKAPPHGLPTVWGPAR